VTVIHSHILSSVPDERSGGENEPQQLVYRWTLDSSGSVTVTLTGRVG